MTGRRGFLHVRILMVSDVYFPRINGVSTSIQTFWRELSGRGHEVTLVAPDYGIDDEDPEGLIRIPSRFLPMDPEDRMLRLRAIYARLPEFARRGYDLVHVQTPFVAHFAGVRLARRLGLPRVESYHTFFEEYLHHYVRWLPDASMRLAARKFSRWQCNNVDALVVPSSAMLERLRAYGVKTPAAIIPTGIEPRDFHSGDGERFRSAHGIGPERPLLVHVGRVAREKNIGFLLRVVERLRREIPDLLLVVAGEGPARHELEREAAALGLAGNVRFVGYLARDGALQDCYCAGDAFVFASRTETQGLVLLEAMALGVPVVSTAVMGTRDILAPGRGALVAEETVEDFAANALRILCDPRLRRHLSGEARACAGEWTAGALAERMIGFYARVVEAHRRGESPVTAGAAGVVPCGEKEGA